MSSLMWGKVHTLASGNTVISDIILLHCVKISLEVKEILQLIIGLSVQLEKDPISKRFTGQRNDFSWYFT